jgi:hypothetical protein
LDRRAGREKSELMASLGLESSGSQGGFLDSDFSILEFPTGWMVVVSMDPIWAIAEVVAQASANGEAVGCQMLEGVMYSSARGFEDGMQTWSLVHYLEEDKVLDIEGEPPPAFAAIRDDAFRLQDEEDHVDCIFDVPVEVTAAICGFRPDLEMPGYTFDTVFEHLRYIPRPKAPASPGPFAWLGRIFSGPS